MKRFIVAGLLGLLSRVSYAACDPSLTPTTTTNIGLKIPQINSCSWGDILNNNFRILDSSIIVQAGTSTFSGTNTFNKNLIIGHNAAIYFTASNGAVYATLFNSNGAASQELEIQPPDGVGIGANNSFSATGSPAPYVLFGSPSAKWGSFGSFAVAGSSNDSTTTYTGFIGTGSVNRSVLWVLPKNDGSNGQLLGTDGSSNLGWYSNTGGGGGGGSIITVNQNAVQITSPTFGLNMLSPPFIITSVGGGTTAQFRLDGSSVTLEGPLLLIPNYWMRYNTFASSTNFAGNLNISSGVLILNNPGTNGQVLTSGGSGVVPSWSTVSTLPGFATLTATQTWSGQNNWTTTGQSTFTYGLTVGSLTISAPGDGFMEFNIAGSTFDATSSSGSFSVGQVAVFSSTNGTLIGSSSIGANPAGVASELQYRSGATSFGAVSHSIVTVSSVSLSNVLISSLVVTQTSTGTAGLNLVSPVGGPPGTLAYLLEFDALSAGTAVGYMGTQLSAAGIPSGLSLFNSAQSEIARFTNSSGGVFIDDPGGLIVSRTPSTTLVSSPFDIIASTTNTYASYISTSATGGWVVAVTTNGIIQASSMSLVTPKFNSANVGQGVLDIWNSNAANPTTNLLTIGSSSQGDILDVPSTSNPILMTHGGATMGTVGIGPTAQVQRIWSTGDNSDYIDLRTAFVSTMTLHTGTSGFGEIDLQPGNVQTMAISRQTGVNIVAPTANPFAIYELTLGTAAQSGATPQWNVAFTTGGFQVSYGTAPTVSSCGSTPNGSVIGDDSRGVITVGGTAPTACTLTFSTVHTGCTMVCNVTDNSATISADISSLTTSALTLGFGVGGLAGGNVYYQCSGYGVTCR